MHLRLFSFLCLLQLSRAILLPAADATIIGSSNAASYDHRTLWSLLASCGATLLICVWYAIHPAVPLPHYKRINVALYWLYLIVFAFGYPEFMIAFAFSEWLKVREMTKRVHDLGYTWWTMTHSHFVLNGGFAVCDDTGIKEVKLDDFLSLVQAGELVNPVITEAEIIDKSTSDALTKAILILQLSWFTVQVVVRPVHHLAVTLVELDTVCMALLTFPLIFFWWTKPRCAGYPHLFYTRGFVNNSQNQNMSEGDNESEKLLDNSTITTSRTWNDLLFPQGISRSPNILLCVTWSIFGALHAIAWNYEFPTVPEKIAWRVSSLTLAATPLIYAVLRMISPYDTIIGGRFSKLFADGCVRLMSTIAFTCRVVLAVVMLASLRSLPSSAYETIPWTNYIPHL